MATPAYNQGKQDAINNRPAPPKPPNAPSNWGSDYSNGRKSVK